MEANIETDDKSLEKVLTALSLCEDGLNFNDLHDMTGLSVFELLSSIKNLTKDNKILFRTKENLLSKEHYVSRKESLYIQFRSLLSKNIRQERSVSFYADKLCVTSKYLSCIVKSISGKSALNWIHEAILKESIYQLCHTSLTVKQIAYLLNFPNSSFFGKFFKSHIGTSPHCFRKKFTFRI